MAKKRSEPPIEGVAGAERVTVLNLIGRPEEREWLARAHNSTRLPRSTIIRLALADWGAARGLPPYPDPAGSIGGK